MAEWKDVSTTSYETPKSHLTANGGGGGLVAKSCPTLATRGL